MAARLPADLLRKVRLVALLGPSHQAGFEFHLTDLLGGHGHATRATVPEIRRLQGLRILCVYGLDEAETACRDLSPGLATSVGVPGGHHFGGAYRDIAKRILKETAAS